MPDMIKGQVPPQQVKVKTTCELVLITDYYNSTKTYEVYSRLIDAEQAVKDSVLKLDYNYTPWSRCGGNLLWQ
jgi:hypothetical protein